MSRLQEETLKRIRDDASRKPIAINARVLESLFARGWVEHAPKCVPGNVALTPRGRAALEERAAEWRDFLDFPERQDEG